MKKQTLFLVLLLTIFFVISKLYYKTWKQKQKVTNFLNQENLHNDKDCKKTQPNITTVKNINNLQKKTNRLKANVVFNGQSNFITKPKIVRTHKNKILHSIIQDDSFNIYLIDQNGKKIWKKPLEEKIISEIFEIDFLRNKKIQYVFATKSKLFIIDYKGNRVAHYPHKFKVDMQNPAFFNLIDYAKNKNYRFLFATHNGDIFLCNKRCIPLIGWKPNVLKYPFLSNPIHLRVKPKDYFVAAHKNGKICLITRKGESYNGFPIDIKENIKEFCVIKSDSPTETRLIALGTNNKLFEYDLRGNKRSQIVLGQNNIWQFNIGIDKTQEKSFFIVKQNNKQIIILNKNQEQIFSKQKNNNNIIKVLCFLPENNKKLFAFFDKKNQCLNIYNINGMALNSLPISVDTQPSILFNKNNNSVSVFCSYLNTLKMYSFNIT